MKRKYQKIDEETRSEILKKYKKGGTSRKDIAAEYNISYITLFKLLKKAGLTGHRKYNKNGQRAKLLIPLDKPLLDRLNEYAFPSQVAEEAIKWYFTALDAQQNAK